LSRTSLPWFLVARSHEAFCIALQFGDAGGVRTTRTRTVLSTASIAEVQWMTNAV
jgi:hypothetical protein